jgi:putative endonuclease
MKTTEIGAAGENLAAEYLKNKGFSIVERNFRTRHLEIDLICENETHLLFVEVKTRTDTGAISKYGRPAAAVDTKKRQHLLDAATDYLRAKPTLKKPRIDVLEVYLNRKGTLMTLSPKGIKHIENALI